MSRSSKIPGLDSTHQKKAGCHCHVCTGSLSHTGHVTSPFAMHQSGTAAPAPSKPSTAPHNVPLFSTHYVPPPSSTAYRFTGATNAPFVQEPHRRFTASQQFPMLYESPRQARERALFQAAASGKANSNGNTPTDEDVADSSKKTAVDDGNDAATLALDDGSSVTSGDSMRVWTGEGDHSRSRYYKSVAFPSPGNPTRYHSEPKLPTVQASSSKQIYRQQVIDCQKRQMAAMGVGLSGDGEKAGVPDRTGRYRPRANEGPMPFSGISAPVPAQTQPMPGATTGDSSDDETGSNGAVVFTPTSSEDPRQTLTDSLAFTPRVSIIPSATLALLSTAAHSFASACDRIEWTGQEPTFGSLCANEDVDMLKREYDQLSSLLRDYQHLFDNPYQDFHMTADPYAPIGW